MSNQPLTKARIEAWEKDRIEKAATASKEKTASPPDPKAYPDGKVPGLALICFLSGTKTWSLFYRTSDGKPRRIKIGRYPILSVDEARDIANDHLNAVTKGRDPVAEKQATKTAVTMAELCDDFEARHVPTLRPSTQVDYKGMIRKYIRPALGKKRVKDVTQADAERLHQKISEKNAKKKGEPTSMGTGGHRRANMVVNVLRAMFNQAIKAKHCADNPASGVKRHKEGIRERYLTSDEIGRLMAVLDQRADRSTDAIRLLLLTGARRNEVLSAEWSHFNLDAGVWIKPIHLVKTKRLHRVPLSGPAVAVLKAMRERAGEGTYLFTGAKGAPQRDLKTAWATIRREAGIPDVRIHDLRHSFASILVNAGASLPLIGSLLGHTQAQTTQRYSHLYDHVMKDATEKVGAAINAAVASGIKPKLKVAA